MLRLSTSGLFSSSEKWLLLFLKRYNEEFCWGSWYLDWTGSKDGSVLVCSWFNCFNGHYQNLLHFLIASMGLQVIWSFGLAFMDAYALLTKKVLHNPVLVSLFVVTATLSLAAAASSAGITVLYFGDLGGCSLGEECIKYEMAIALAFLSWITIAISSLIMFWLLAAG
ncbi:CASP-like protein 5B3 isoform X2 [Sesamum indicum]|uniref:CASP-like protein n=1 Tax=Sesamum indicum TaxID=4182 RepID=A0A8M8V1N4_SESIN|nr:CASP-like protein 5B3 isoform X2 [Sesamum indicum]